MTTDFDIADHGSIIILRPVSTEARPAIHAPTLDRLASKLAGIGESRAL